MPQDTLTNQNAESHFKHFNCFTYVTMQTTEEFLHVHCLVCDHRG